MKPTREQKKDQERLDRYIAREGLSSVMNQTKWREAIDVLLEVLGYGLRFRVKCLREPDVAGEHWVSSFPDHLPRPLRVIEWLEIDPVIRKRRGNLVQDEVHAHTDAVFASLRARSIPCFEVDGLIRIPGYLRGTPPQR